MNLIVSALAISASIGGASQFSSIPMDFYPPTSTTGLIHIDTVVEGSFGDIFNIDWSATNRTGLVEIQSSTQTLAFTGTLEDVT